MVAIIGDSANFASITLHRRAGFRFCGTIHSVGYKFGRWLDSVVMELPWATATGPLRPSGSIDALTSPREGGDPCNHPSVCRPRFVASLPEGASLIC